MKGNSYRVEYPLGSFSSTETMMKPVVGNFLKAIKKYFYRQSAPKTVNGSLCVVSSPTLHQEWCIVGTVMRGFWFSKQNQLFSMNKAAERK